MRKDGAEANFAKGFGFGIIYREKVRCIRLGVDSLVPIVGAFGIGCDLCRGAEVKGRTACASFRTGDAIIAIDIDKGRIDIFSFAVDDNGVFGYGSAGARADDESVADDQGRVGKGRLSVFDQGSVCKCVTAFPGIGYAVDGKGGLGGAKERKQDE